MRIRTLRFPSLLLPLLLSALPAAQTGGTAKEPGEVRTFNKISRVTLGTNLKLHANDQYGRSAISPGDLDGDGVLDLMVGAINDDDGGSVGAGSDLGAVWVHFMNQDGSVRSTSKISQTAGGFTGDLDTRDQFGRSLAPLGDFDGDGVPDVAVGSSRDDDGGVNHGSVWLLFMNSDGSVKSHQKISDTAGGFTGVLEDLDEFGRGVANIGDLNGDGVVDLAVGAIGDDDGGVDMKGAVWILFLNPDGTVLSHQKISDTAGNFDGILTGGDMFGLSVGALGDLNGDGVPDLAVGAPKDNDGGVRKGAAWVLFMNPDGTVSDFYEINDKADVFGLGFMDEFATAVTGIGDVDGDGVTDLAVGTILDDGLHHDGGAVWIIYLNPDGTWKDRYKINDVMGGFQNALDDDDWFGSSVGWLGDFDGDGISDLVVGARFDDDGALDAGAAYMLFLEGEATVAPRPNFTVSPATGTTPFLATFTDLSTAGASTWSWDFGDGGTSSLQHPMHAYTVGGTYDVSLTVTGPGGVASLVREDFIEVSQSAQAIFRNGSGVNVACFTSITPPVIGSIWSAEVDASHRPGAGWTYIIGTNSPHPGLVLSAGELLVTGPIHFASIAHSGGGVAQHLNAIPDDPALAGLVGYLQGMIVGGGLELCNALDVVLGY